MGALPIELLPKGKGYAWDSFQSLVDGAKDFYTVAKSQPSNKKLIIVTNNDAQGVATAKRYSGLGRTAGFRIVGQKAVPSGTTDFSDVISMAKSTDAQVLVAAMTPPDCFAMWKQMKALKYQPKLAIGVQCAQTPGWATLGALGDGTLLQTNWTDTSGLPGATDLAAHFNAKYPNLNDKASVAIGIHEATILMDAISKAGSTSADAINKALAGATFSSALGPVRFKDNKSATPSFIGQWVDSGKINQVWPAKGAKPVQPLSGLG
jgi:ABC-type branched-subunit amino acid transport system substrate-binding protein